MKKSTLFLTALILNSTFPARLLLIVMLAGGLILNSPLVKAQPISTIAGNGTAGYSGDAGAATSAMLNYPLGVAVDAAGNVYISDYSNQMIRKVNTSGIISAFAGTAGTNGSGGDGGPATSAMLNNPNGVAVDAAGNVYVADVGNNKIRKINTSTGIINTFAGNGTNGFSGDGGPATSAMLNYPIAVAVDAAGNVYITDNYRIRKINTSGIISTFAGTGGGGYNGDNISATSANLNNPAGVAVDAAGNVYIADESNQRIRIVNTSGIISTFAGTGTQGWGGDGVATSIQLNYPAGIAVDAAGNLYITDQGTHRIRKVNTSGMISTIAGNGSGAFSGDGGPATSASINNPYGVAVDGTGNVYIADQNNQRVRKVSPCAVITVNINFTTNVSCYGGNNGSAAATVSGGTSPIAYLWQISNDGGTTWTNFATGSSINNLQAASYALTVTDAGGCTATAASVTITQPATAVSASIISQTNVSCHGMCNGSATASGTGGVSPYSYSWNTTPSSQTTQTATGLCFAGYLVTVTDGNNCTATSNVGITQPSTLSVSTNSNTTICSGQSVTFNGTAATGGTPTYYYNWSPATNLSCTTCASPIASPTITTNYVVTATDANTCTAQANCSVTVNSTPTPTVTVTPNPVCSGQTLSLNASTISGATYNWSGPNSFSSSLQNPNITSATSATAGTYSVLASLSGCTSPAGTTSVTVNASPPAPTASSNSPVNAGSTLSLSASTITGATYNWYGPSTYSSASQNPTITNVTTANAGTYSVTATKNGCTSVAGTMPVSVTTFSITANTNSVTCYGGNDGAASVSVSGGQSPYTYAWSTAPVQTDQAIFSLYAGTYSVTISDANSASSVATVTINQPSQITIITSQTSISCYGGSNGIAHSIVSGGGISPYSYSWNTFPVQTTANAGNLSAGNYTVTVKDANGCTKTNSVTVTQPTALTVSMTIVNSDCGITDGSAKANVSGGTASYSYLWNNSQTTQTISNIGSGNYSVTVTDAKGCTINTTTAVGIIPSNFNLAFSATIQNGSAPFNATFNNSTPSMSSYNFKWFYGDGNSANDNNSSVFYTYNFAGTYDVALIATSIANGCTDTLVKTHYINVTGTGCAHTVSVTPSGPINTCQGDTTILTAGTNAVAPFTYQWNIGSVAITGASTNTFVVTQGGYYSLTVIKNTCPVTSSAVAVNYFTNPQQPTISSIGTIVPCVGGAVTLSSSTVSGATYTWNTSPVQSSQSIVVNSSGNYEVTATNSAGCKTVSSPVTVNASLAQTPICLVTVDSLSQNNIIIWEKQPNQHIDSFIVYREISTNLYKPIGAVPYDSLSLFVDTVRTKYFPNTGNPNAGTYRYKVAIRDTCGNYSPLSLYHNTIYIINNSGTFFWPQLYSIENSANPVTNYVLMRDNISNGNWQQVQSVAGTQQTVTDPQYSTYQNTASWRIQTQWGIGCSATIVNPKNPVIEVTNLNSSRSNVYKVNNPTSVFNLSAEEAITIYPNPNSGVFTLDIKNISDASIRIFNMLGEEIKQFTIQNSGNKTEVDLREQAKGVYYLQVTSSQRSLTKKIIIE